MGVYQIWTVQMSRSRNLKDKGIHALDTTVKSGIKAFAPKWDMVMAHKEQRLSDAQYTDQYTRMMRESRQNNHTIWKKLQDHEKTAVLCYCSPGKFCHRHLFIHEMKDYLESLGHTVELKGEINGPQYYSEIPKAVVSIPRDEKIVPFYSKYDLLSNHNPSGFTIKGVTFKHVEQFMMYCKAMLFNDKLQAGLILAEPDPQKCKILGRGVRPFDEALWVSKRRRYVYLGCLQKAREHKEVRDYLLSTGNAILVEASPRDTIWGVGIAKEDPRIYDIEQWQGLNLLGEIWMEVRRVLQAEVVF
jgi:ribA/ribD-fused uncharacterized protein